MNSINGSKNTLSNDNDNGINNNTRIVIRLENGKKK